MLREAMKKVQRAAQELPISNQVKECEEFIGEASGSTRPAEVEIVVGEGRWPECAGKQEPQFASTPSSVI